MAGLGSDGIPLASGAGPPAKVGGLLVPDVLVTELMAQEQARFGLLVHAAHSLLVSPPLSLAAVT